MYRMFLRKEQYFELHLLHAVFFVSCQSTMLAMKATANTHTHTHTAETDKNCAKARPGIFVSSTTAERNKIPNKRYPLLQHWDLQHQSIPPCWCNRYCLCYFVRAPTPSGCSVHGFIVIWISPRIINIHIVKSGAMTVNAVSCMCHYARAATGACKTEKLSIATIISFQSWPSGSMSQQRNMRKKNALCCFLEIWWAVHRLPQHKKVIILLHANIHFYSHRCA